MKTIVCWEMSIRARWFRSVALLALGLAPALAGTGSAATSFAPAATQFGQGVNAWNVKDYAAVPGRLRGLNKQLPKIADYIAYYLAGAEMQAGDTESVVRDLAEYRANPAPSSPLAGKISVLYAQALLARKQGTSSSKALEVLQTDYKLLPQPDGDYTLGMAYEALGEKPQAALSYSKVYYSWPNTDQAAHAWTALEALRPSLGKEFPAAPARQQLERCQKWLDVRQYAAARTEYVSLSSSLPEPDRDEARVGIGVADYMAGLNSQAAKYLKDLKVANGETDARRLYYLADASRRTGDDAGMVEAVKELSEHYGQSQWRLKGLLAAGNRYQASGDRDQYTPYFRTAISDFDDDTTSASAHWTLAWDAWLLDKPDQAGLMREQVERYPADSHAGTALYYLGRGREKNGKFDEARAFYETLSQHFPHYFYAVLGRERLRDSRIAGVQPSETVQGWLRDVDWPVQRDFSSSVPNAATTLRIERARLLMMAGLPDLADTELRFGAKNDAEQPHLLALELARSMPSPFQALRIMKSFGTDYLALPFENAPIEFWQKLFPLPYRDDVNRNAKAFDLDPYSVAGLIRQETEFNPNAHSYANAYGLMQLIPGTGRMMARQAGVTIPTTSRLFDPSLSIQLGTRYLRQQLDTWDGDWYETLAAYNAGPNRVKQWTCCAKFREPAEFVESIPITQTREYVQAVMRNADMYRRLYGERHAVPMDVKDPAEVPPVNLSLLPAAARTPGGGVKTAVSSAKKTTVAKKPAAAPRKAVATKAPARRKPGV
jgi:soluble lytic murein transglycosylase